MAGIRTALLIIDMQNFFVEMTAVSLPNVTKLVRAFQAAGQPTIFTQHGHKKEDLTPPYTNQLVRKWGPEGSIQYGSEDWQLIPEVKKLVRSDDAIVDKNTYDAFLGPGDLEGVLRKEEVGTVVVCGVMTDCCCDTTARSAFNRGYETYLVRDACGSANKSQHLAGLKAFGFAFGDVVDTSDIIKLLKKEK